MRASALCIRGNTLKQTMRRGPACPQHRGRFPDAGCAPGNVPDAGELPPPGLSPSNRVTRAVASARAGRGTAPDDPDPGAPRPRAQKRSPGGRPWASGAFEEVRKRARVRAQEFALPAAPERLRMNRPQARPARGLTGKAAGTRLREPTAALIYSQALNRAGGKVGDSRRGQGAADGAPAAPRRDRAGAHSRGRRGDERMGTVRAGTGAGPGRAFAYCPFAPCPPGADGASSGPPCGGRQSVGCGRRPRRRRAIRAGSTRSCRPRSRHR